MDIFDKLKQMVMEPKVYTILVKSPRGQVLHLGVHFSLEEAYAVARRKLERLSPTTQIGEPMDIDMWNSIPARQLVSMIMDPQKTPELVEMPKEIPPPTEDAMFPQHEHNGAVFVSGEADFNDLPQIVKDIINGKIGASKPDAESKKEETVATRMTALKESKNALMKQLIETGDIAEVEKVKSILGSNSSRYVIKAIEKKKKS